MYELNTGTLSWADSMKFMATESHTAGTLAEILAGKRAEAEIWTARADAIEDTDEFRAWQNARSAQQVFREQFACARCNLIAFMGPTFRVHD